MRTYSAMNLEKSGICEAEGCTTPSKTHTYCSVHRKLIRHCRVEWCDDGIHGRGYCLRHYNRLLWFGHPYLRPGYGKDPKPDSPLSVRDREVLRLLAHGDFVEIVEIVEILGVKHNFVRQSVYKIRKKFGYDVVIHDRVLGGYKLSQPIPGIKKHPSLL